MRLSLEDVRFAYGTSAGAADALAGVSLALRSGERVAVIGPNGAGKSTLLRVASGLLPPSSGRVLLDGADLARLPRAVAARRLAGVAAEEAHDFPFRVRESVALGRHAWRGAFAPPSATDEERVVHALAGTALTELAERPVASLSSGERQRVALARALAQDADVLLLDEPTAHLDLGHQTRLLALVGRHVAARGGAALAALHDVNLAAAWADRLVLLVAGRIVGEGTARDVLTEAALERAFGAPVRVVEHPDRDLPLVVPRSAR
jgi:iron complex transport system ATP-binding protein